MSKADKLNPNAMAIKTAAAVLTKASGQPVTVQMLSEDVAAGLPTNPDGTLNLVLYAAWLLGGVNGN